MPVPEQALMVGFSTLWAATDGGVAAPAAMLLGGAASREAEANPSSKWQRTNTPTAEQARVTAQGKSKHQPTVLLSCTPYRGGHMVAVLPLNHGSAAADVRLVMVNIILGQAARRLAKQQRGCTAGERSCCTTPQHVLVSHSECSCSAMRIADHPGMHPPVIELPLTGAS